MTRTATAWFPSELVKTTMEEPETMADSLRMALQELLRKAELEQDADFLRDGAQALAQALMELELSQHLGAERYERSPERRGERNGYRDRIWDTRVGTLELRVPRVRDGSFFPSLLEPRKRAERSRSIFPVVELTRSRGHLKIGAGEPLMRSPHAENPTALCARVSRGSG